jgi:hypothetical protein
MKSRQRKHIERLIKRSPIIAFSKGDTVKKQTVLRKEKLTLFSKSMGLSKEYIDSTNYKEVKEEMYSNLLMFTDNYFLSGGHKEVYLLIPLKSGKYQVIEKENIDLWRDAYWKKEDPENKRDWCYFDEDINELFDYIMQKFDKYNK